MLDFDDGTSLTTLCYDKSSKGNNWTLNNFSLTAGTSYATVARLVVVFAQLRFPLASPAPEPEFSGFSVANELPGTSSIQSYEVPAVSDQSCKRLIVVRRFTQELANNFSKCEYALICYRLTF
jgi:hypothetical protein